MLNLREKVHTLWFVLYTSEAVLFPVIPTGVARAQICGASGSGPAPGGAPAQTGELRGAARDPGPPLQGPRAGDRERRDAVPRTAQGQRHPAEELRGAALRAAPTLV